MAFCMCHERFILSALLMSIACSYHSGQMCVAGSRIFVQEGIYDRFIQAFTAIARSFRLGDGFDPDTNQGPLISDIQLKVSVYDFSTASSSGSLTSASE